MTEPGLAVSCPHMGNLSEDDCIAISKNPLDTSLNDVRDALRTADQAYQLATINLDDASHTAEEVLLVALSELFSILHTRKVAKMIKSKAGNDNLKCDILTLLKRLENIDFNYEHYRALSQLVIEMAPDVDIWNAVLDLISFISRLTPPPRFPVSFNGTLVVYSSASMKCDEQTKILLELSLFEEIKNCTYRNVEGFFAKYFEGKNWSKQSKEIYEAMKDLYVDGKWIDFPDPPGEHAVWKWLSRIQDKYLTETRGIYYRTSTTADLVGGEARRQLDLFIKRRTVNVDTRHDWKDVQVIGEHQINSKDWKSKFLQICRYVRDAFIVQPTRRYIHAFTILGTSIELWVFDRSGPYSSGAFCIHNQPEKFIRALVGYTLMSDSELGLDCYIEHGDQVNSIIIQEDSTKRDIKIQLEQKPLIIQRAIVCRGTTCYRSKDRKKVVKLSWPSDLRQQESKLLRRARENGVEGVATLVGHHDITTIKDLRDGLKFPRPHRFRDIPPLFQFQSPLTSRSCRTSQTVGSSQISLGMKRKFSDKDSQAAKRLISSYQKSTPREKQEAHDNSKDENRGQEGAQEELYKNRIFSCMVISPAGRMIKEFQSVKELLTALRDAIKGHRSLFEKARILHRDISENNIIITDPESANGFTGMLIDLDLAIEDNKRTGGRQMTGTMEFMAIDVLCGCEHTYRHDLESFFYVLLWMCARCAWDRGFLCSTNDRPRASVLKSWYGSSAAGAADAKTLHMYCKFREILDEFAPAFHCIEPLCMKLHGLLFPFINNNAGLGWDRTTKLDHRKLYDPFIQAFDDAIADLETGL